jgi:activator of HSP90 ATPase
MTYDFEVSAIVPAAPRAIFDAWMSSAGHAAMTGAGATVRARVAGPYSAWDGYITGRTLALDPGRRIVQSWRTAEFAEGDPDSTIEVLLDPVRGGTRVTIRHTGVPADQTGYERGGWQENYFEPMQAYFGG